MPVERSTLEVLGRLILGEVLEILLGLGNVLMSLRFADVI